MGRGPEAVVVLNVGFAAPTRAAGADRFAAST
jgi:hypothetical protein